jgi:tetratricopeptide (TPR) repeat protein
MRYLKAAGYDPEAAVSLQQTFVKLSEGRNPSWLEGLFASHPPSQARVEANRRIARELGPGGERYRQRYQRMIAGLRQDEPAYEAYQEGARALAKEDYAAARQQAERALAIEPKEALFHILKGEALRRQGELSAAAASYQRAIADNPRYFQSYLGAGITLQSLGQASRARDYLARSIEILPTAEGYLYLGDAAMSEGDRQAAIAHWQQAAGSESPAGQAARARLNEIGAGTP